MRRVMLFVIGAALCLPLVGWTVTRTVKYIQYNIHVDGRLKRAADANTVELAEKELSYVVQQIEKRGWTEGSTNLLWWEPSNDVGFWYTNLKDSLRELRKVSPETTQLERTNLLMKLRETILDQHGNSVVVTAPPGISVYPYNVAYCWWGWGGLILLLPGALCIFVAFVRD